MLPQPPSRLNLANLPTPLRKLEALSSELNKNIWLKSDDQSGFVLSGNKVRKLEYLLADAKLKGADVVITCGGVQSNHCRATAFACAQLGLGCHLILRKDSGYKDNSSEGLANHFLDQICGATYELYEPSSYFLSLVEHFKAAETRCVGNGFIPYSIPTGGSNGLGVWGYLSAFEELVEQYRTHDFQPDLVVCASGSGGTQAGLTLGQYFLDGNVEVLGFAVCDNENYFDKKVRQDIYDWSLSSDQNEKYAARLAKSVNVITNDRYIGPGYSRAYPELYRCISKLARTEGVLLDQTYTGKAFYGLLEEIRVGRLEHVQNIIFVHTGGGFGLFPHAAEFVESNS